MTARLLRHDRLSRRKCVLDRATEVGLLLRDIALPPFLGDSNRCLTHARHDTRFSAPPCTAGQRNPRPGARQKESARKNQLEWWAFL